MVCCKSCYSLKVPGTWLEFDDLESSVSHFIEQSIEWNQDVTKIKSKSEYNLGFTRCEFLGNGYH